MINTVQAKVLFNLGNLFVPHNHELIKVTKVSPYSISKANFYFFLFGFMIQEKKHKNLILSVKMLCSTYYCY